MRRAHGVVASALVVAAGLGTLTPIPAHATSIVVGAAVVTGSGVITPGLTLAPWVQSVTFTGRATGAVAVASVTPQVTGVVAFDGLCAFSGSSNAPETSLRGEGTMIGNCTGPTVFAGMVGGTPVLGPGTVTAVCTLQYSRAVAVLLVGGRCVATVAATSLLGGISNVTVAACVLGEFAFMPTSLPTTATYFVAGAVDIHPDKVTGCVNPKHLP